MHYSLIYFVVRWAISYTELFGKGWKKIGIIKEKVSRKVILIISYCRNKIIPTHGIIEKIHYTLSII